jgi:cobalt-zinc-cadmium efflux system outer membrane protein
MGVSSNHREGSSRLRCRALLAATVAAQFVAALARADSVPAGSHPRRVPGGQTSATAAGSVGHAQEPTLSIDAAVREALQSNRDLRAAYFAIGQARARLLQAGLWPNPALDFSGARDVLFANEGEYTVSVGFEQRFPVAGRLARARDLARVDVALALAEVQDARRRLVGAVETTFYELLILQAQIVIRDDLIGIDRRLVEVSEARAKLAEVSELDVNTARLELQRLELERQVLSAQAAVKTTELNRLLGRQANAPLSPTGEIRPEPPTALPTLREAALRRRPDLQQAALTADRAHAELRLAKAERWEDWVVGFGYDRDRQVVTGAPSQSADQLLGLRLTVPLPVWNRNQGRIAEAGAREGQATSTVAALELTILSEIESAHRRVADFGRVAESYRAGVAPLSDRTVQVAQDAYRQGLANVTQVVQVQRQQTEVRAAYLEALAQQRRAAIDLEVATATSPFLDEAGGSR